MKGLTRRTVRLLLEDGRVLPTEDGFVAACRDGDMAIVDALLADRRVDPGVQAAVTMAPRAC